MVWKNEKKGEIPSNEPKNGGNSFSMPLIL